MTLELGVLSLATIAAVSIGLSTGVCALWPVLRGALRRLTPAGEWRALFALSCLPLFGSMLVLAACFLPSMGLSTDHCLHHGLHHPHLCLHHASLAAPTLVAIGLAGFVAVRAVQALGRALRGLLRSRSTSRTLSEAAATNAAGIRVLPSPGPDAFVLGLLRPKLFVSRGLLSLPRDAQRIVLAHERAHVERRDPLRHLVATAVLGFHLPGIASILRRRLQVAAEMAADAQAADTCCDGAKVADVLVRLSRVHQAQPAPGVGFVGDLEVRVSRLLAPRGLDVFGPAVLCVVIGAIVVVTFALAAPLHHAVETLLGLLS